MPKREIRAQDYRFVPFADGTEVGPGKQFPPECRLGQLHIGWSRPGDIVEVITHDETMRQNLWGPVLAARDVFMADSTAANGLLVMQAIDQQASTWPTFGVAVTLDRAGVQDALRALKEGRNAVFGRDE